MGTDRGKSTFKVPADKAERRLAVTYRPISELKLNPKNPRAHSPRQIRQIARSIETFTFLVPVLVDGHGNVLAGHGRILAAQLLGWTEVPVISVDHLSENQARACMTPDTRLTENWGWDDRLLAQQLKELSKLELDFSLEVTGFERSFNCWASRRSSHTEFSVRRLSAIMKALAWFSLRWPAKITGTSVHPSSSAASIRP